MSEDQKRIEEMTDIPDHLRPVTSDRGFNRLPAIPSEYGGNVRVYESSAAMAPHIWLNATAPVNLNEPDGETCSVPIHLTLESASKLADQIRWLVDHHYQGTPPVAALEDLSGSEG
jgi:hypothetical protein